MVLGALQKASKEEQQQRLAVRDKMKARQEPGAPAAAQFLSAFSFRACTVGADKQELAEPACLQSPSLDVLWLNGDTMHEPMGRLCTNQCNGSCTNLICLLLEALGWIWHMNPRTYIISCCNSIIP